MDARGNSPAGPRTSRGRRRSRHALTALAAALLTLSVALIPALAASGGKGERGHRPAGLSQGEYPTISKRAMRPTEAGHRAAPARRSSARARRASRRRHRNLSPRRALALLRREFPSVAARRTGGTASLPKGAKIRDYLGDYAASVKIGGRRQLLVSSVPLRTRANGGKRLARVDLGLQFDDGAYQPVNPLVDAIFPTELEDGIEVGDDGITVRPEVDDEAAAAIATGDQVFYASTERDTDVVATSVSSGVELFAQLRSPLAPETQTMQFELPVGASLTATPDGGAEITRDGERLARILPPEAADADGRDVDATLRVVGDRVDVTVAHRAASHAYPILLDPVIEDWGSMSAWRNSWFFNPDLDQLGWSFADSPDGAFLPATEGTTIRSYGTGPGRGLYVFAKPSKEYPAGAYGEWLWRAPGQTTFIPRVDFGLTYLDKRGDSGNQSVLTQGIWSEELQEPVGFHTFRTPLSAANDTVLAGDNVPGANALEGNLALFALALPKAHARPKWTTAYLGGAAIYLDDPEAPGLEVTSRGSVGGGFVGDDAAIAATATDPGLGVRAIELTTQVAGGGTHVETSTHPCGGNRFSQCPDTWATSLPYGSALPEGESTVSLTATDVLGHRSAPVSWTARVDRSAPALALSGPLADADGDWVGAGSLSLGATATEAGGSGAESIEVLVDGERADFVEQDCEDGGCELTRSFEFDPSDYSQGLHTITVRARDQLGNVTERSLEVGVDATDPGLELGGELAERDGRWVGDSELALAARATDAASGIRSAELLVDGERVDLVEQDCVDGGCPLDRDFTFDGAAHEEGAHEIAVRVVDHAGRTTTRSIQVQVDRTDPDVAATGELLAPGPLSAGAYGLDVAATDLGSGAVSLSVLLDGDEIFSAEQECADGGCTLTRSTSVDLSAVEPGNHVVEVRVRDAVGRVATHEITVTVRAGGDPPACETSPPTDEPCPELSQTVSWTSVFPGIVSTLTPNRVEAVPGDELTQTVEVRNDGGTINISGTVDLRNQASTDAVIRSYYTTFEYLSRTTGEWTTLAAYADGDPSYTPRQSPEESDYMWAGGWGPTGDGVTVDMFESGWPFAGARIAPGATAHWDTYAGVWLESDVLARVMDPEQSAGVRQLYHFELTSTGEDGTQRVTTANVTRRFDELLETQSDALRDVEVDVTGPPGGESAHFDASTDGALAEIAQGGAVSVTARLDVPSPEPRRDDETDEQYLQRLQQADGAGTRYTAVTKARSPGGATTTVPPAESPEDPCWETASCPVYVFDDYLLEWWSEADVSLHVPVVSLAASGSDEVQAGTSATYSYTLKNTGSADAALDLRYRFGEADEAFVAGVPDTLAPGEEIVVNDHPVVPADAAGDLVTASSLRWRDSSGGEYGPVTSDVRTEIYNDSKASDPLDAPALDQTRPTGVDTSSEFLYEGPDRVQFGVQEETIVPQRAAMLRGRVTERDGSPMVGARVTVTGHPEYGVTYSREDGAFYMAVNGGGALTVHFTRPGFLPVEREVQVPWQGYGIVDDAALIPLSPVADEVELDGLSEAQIAEGPTVSDSDGQRESTLLFQPDTDATMTLPDGSTRPLENLTVRQTEYTVGPEGPATMPAPLPQASGYTYAVEYSIDEAQAARATSVEFSRPVISYTTNFLGFPVGEAVPAGYLDRATGNWVASKNGRVIEVLSTDGGSATLDVDGSGQPADAEQLAELGVDSIELGKIASEFQPGDQLWRVPIDHFTPWDFNWPWGPPPGSRGPDLDGDGVPDAAEGECQDYGSIIGCERQTLGEAVHVDGTPFSLHYDTARSGARKTDEQLSIPVAGSSLPTGVKRIVVEGSIAGQQIRRTLEAEPRKRFNFEWDGNDAFGRPVQGAKRMNLRVGYVYDATYQDSANLRQSFGRLSGTPMGRNVASREITLWGQASRSLAKDLGTSDALGDGLGGWGVDVHHAYDPFNQVLYLGNGERRTATAMNQTITTVAGTGVRNRWGSFCGTDEFSCGPSVRPVDGTEAKETMISPDKPSVMPDGSVVFSDVSARQVRRLRTDGRIDGFDEYGARTASAAPDGSLLYDFTFNFSGSSLWRVAAGDVECKFTCDPGNLPPVEHVAGTSQGCCGGDDAPATSARIQATDVVVSPDGTTYVGQYLDGRTRAIGTDGMISSIIGDGSNGRGDGGPASSAGVAQFGGGIAAGPDGALYIADRFNHRIRRITKDGLIDTVAGTGERGFGGDGGEATEAKLDHPADITVGQDGTLYIADINNHRVRRVDTDGTITTIAGNGTIGVAGDGGPATQAELGDFFQLGVAPDGSVLISDFWRNRLRKVSPSLPGFTDSEIAIPSSDGAEVYKFDARGRHLATLDGRTRSTVFEFDYDDAGRLASITDSEGKETRIERDGAGNPAAMVAPTGQRTTLHVDSAGRLEGVTDPAQARTSMTYNDAGLLETFTDPEENTSTFEYDGEGRLIKDSDAAGGSKTLTRTDSDDGFEVSVETHLGRAVRRTTERLPSGGTRRRATAPDGTVSETTTSVDGTVSSTSSDGTTIVSEGGPDSRFGMQAPMSARSTLTTPGGVRYEIEQSKTSSGRDPDDFMTFEQLTDTTTVNGKSWTRVFDAGSGLQTSTSPTGRSVSVQFDSKGRPVVEHGAGLADTITEYDEDGRVETRRQGEREWSYEYDDRGRLAAAHQPGGHVTRYAHDDRGRVTRKTLPGGAEVGYTYDRAGNLTSVTPPGRSAHTFEHTPVNEVESYAPPGTPPVRFRYNEDQALTAVERAGGTTVSIDYNDAGRPASSSAGGDAVTYSYDADTGNISSIDGPSGQRVTYGFDGGLHTSQSLTGAVSGSITRTFDDNLRVATTTVAGTPAVAYDYDDDGLLTALGQLNVQRDPASGFMTGTDAGAVTTAHQDNEHGEPTSLTARASDQLLLSRTLARDELGRIESFVEGGADGARTVAYEYDDAGRLTDVRAGDELLAHYEYDDNGNRTVKTTPEGSVSADYDAQDRLTRYGSTTFDYTADGELESRTDSATDATESYDYDGFGHLVGVDLADGRRVDYAIDGEGQRVAKKVDGALAQGFVYGWALNPMAELGPDGEVRSVFVYGLDDATPSYMIRGGDAYRIVSDERGSARLVVRTSDGAVVQRLAYDEFGNVVEDSNPGFQPFGYGGGLYDRDTGLVRFGVRDYDPETGRFTSKDPLRFDGGDTNLYGYALADPINLVDPTGQTFLDDLKNGAKKVGEVTSNTAAGILDGASGGLSTDLAGKLLGFNPDCVDWGPGFGVGQGVGTVASLAYGGAGVVRAAGAVGRAGGRAGVRGIPAGSRRSPMNVPGIPPQNAASTINGVRYTGHALDQMQGRGLTPSVIENTLKFGRRYPGKKRGTTVVETSEVRVIVNRRGHVITVYPIA